ncbi:hypothetical protein FOZ62_028788 [Perkinsus olseni]|uniref:Uncharacterized protein n=1 Tax=Perkinsus olseni TaxID=32597 RepID=A0A7J6SHU3_PEROL|nr:hypothetical protein FOZ62_028788 [Perkinsus olseni]
MYSTRRRPCHTCIDSLTLEIEVFNRAATSCSLVDDLKTKVWGYLPTRHLPNSLKAAEVTSGLRRSHGFICVPRANPSLSIECAGWQTLVFINSQLTNSIAGLPGEGAQLIVGLEGSPENPNIVPYFLNDSRIQHSSCVVRDVFYFIPRAPPHTRQLKRFHIPTRQLLSPIRLPWEIADLAVADDTLFIISGRGDYGVYILLTELTEASSATGNAKQSDTAYQLCRVAPLPIDLRDTIVGVLPAGREYPQAGEALRASWGIFGNQMSSLLDEDGRLLVELSPSAFKSLGVL